MQVSEVYYSSRWKICVWNEYISRRRNQTFFSLYSKNGTSAHGMSGESFQPDDDVMVGSLDDFFNGQYNKDANGNTLYDRALLIHTDEETDAAIVKGASERGKVIIMF